MKEIKLSQSCTISLYSSVKELPIVLSKKFNAYILQDAGIGNSMEDVDDHLQRLMMFVNADSKQEILTELKNLRFNIFSALNAFHYKSAAFGCLIAKVNGIDVNDYSPEGLTALIARLSDEGLNEGKVAETIEEVKKNLIPSVSFTSQSILEMT